MLPETDQNELSTSKISLPKSKDTFLKDETGSDIAFFFNKVLFSDSGPIEVKFVNLANETIDIKNLNRQDLNSLVVIKLELIDPSKLPKNHTEASVRKRIEDLNTGSFRYVEDLKNSKPPAELKASLTKLGGDLYKFAQDVDPDPSLRKIPAVQQTKTQENTSNKLPASGLLNIIVFIMLLIRNLTNKSTLNRNSSSLFKAPRNSNLSAQDNKKDIELTELPPSPSMRN